MDLPNDVLEFMEDASDAASKMAELYDPDLQLEQLQIYSQRADQLAKMVKAYHLVGPDAAYGMTKLITSRLNRVMRNMPQAMRAD